MLVLPKDVQDPPAVAIMKELKTVDAAHEGFGIIAIMA
jgi:hypothetical protein